MNGFRVKTAVNVHDVDYNGIAKTSAIMRYIQTAAQSQLTENGMSYDKLKERGRAFILSRFKLEVLKPLIADTPLTAITFPCESRGYSFLRCYALEENGITVARAISVWALINTDNHGLVRVNDFELGLPTLPPLDLILNPMKLPSAVAEVGAYGVHYGDVDRNKHMNNTAYPDMYSSFLPMEGKMIRSLAINYQNEARLGEKLSVQRAFENGLYYFRTVRTDGKINSEAQIELVEI